MMTGRGTAPPRCRAPCPSPSPRCESNRIDRRDRVQPAGGRILNTQAENTDRPPKPQTLLNPIQTPQRAVAPPPPVLLRGLHLRRARHRHGRLRRGAPVLHAAAAAAPATRARAAPRPAVAHGAAHHAEPPVAHQLLPRPPGLRGSPAAALRRGRRAGAMRSLGCGCDCDSKHEPAPLPLPLLTHACTCTYDRAR